MINLQAAITDIELLHGRVLYRDGFVFTSLANIGQAANIFDAIVVRNPIEADCFSPKLAKSSRSLRDHIDVINHYQLEKAVVIADNIDFLRECPSLRYLQIIPADIADAFDFSPVYVLTNVRSLNCATEYGIHFKKSTEIDYARIVHLEDLLASGNGHFNISKLPNLRRLDVSRHPARNFLEIVSSPILESLHLTQCRLKSLEGISNFKNIKDLSLWHNRCLTDIGEISQCGDSLKSLSIEACSRIEDFSFLESLRNLEHLELLGSNCLPNLDFLPRMKKLTHFVFSVNIVDGNLSNCLSVPYVYSLRNRKHYNLLDRDLPKGT